MRPFIIGLACLACIVRASDNEGVANPDIDTILNTLSQHADISQLLQFVNEYKMAQYYLQELTPVLPLIDTMLNTAAKKNAKLEVLLKVMKGEMPNIHDLYKLATVKSGSILDDIRSSKDAVPGWRKYQSLIHSRNLLSSHTGLEELIQVFTGKGVHLKQSLVQRMSSYSSDFKMAPGDDIASANMVEFLHFVVKNYKPITDISDDIMGLTRPMSTLSAFLQFDFSNLEKIVETTDLYKDGKYQVGSRSPQPDPEVIRLMNDLTSARALKSDEQQVKDKAQSLIMDIIKDTMDIGVKCLKSLN